MKYYLYLWITGCVGFGCPIPDYLQQPYENEEECNKALETAMKVADMTDKAYAGICIPEDVAKRIERGQGK